MIALLLAPHGRADWVALARGGVVLPQGRDAGDMLVEMSPLLVSTRSGPPRQRRFSAAKRWM